MLGSHLNAESRKVLTFYSEKHGKNVTRQDYSHGIELVLNHLGFKLSYYDTSDGLPDISAFHDSHALIVWLQDDDLFHNKHYWDLIEQLLEQKVKVLLLQQGPMTVHLEKNNSIDIDYINQKIQGLGVQFIDEQSLDPADIKIEFIDKKIMNFEKKVQGNLSNFVSAKSTEANNKVFLRLKKVSSNSVSDSVIVSKKGAVVMGNYLFYMEPFTFKPYWLLDPFQFFELALGSKHWPKPDTSTLFGKRIYYSHIDGDGYTGVSHASSDDGKKTQCANIFETEIATKYPHLPTSVSIIQSEIDPQYSGAEFMIDQTRRLFRLPHIEAASHTFSHPFIWDTRLLEQYEIEQYDEQDHVYAAPQHILLPKLVKNYEYNDYAEIVGSIDYINNTLASNSKQTKLLFWSGSCLPNAKQLELAASANLLTINGGDGRMDSFYPSYINLAPLYREIGPYTQVFTSMPNEMLYSDNWSQDYASFREVIQTFKNTEHPIRIKPINVYYHFFLLELQAGVNALRDILDWVKTQDIFPLFTSRYVEIVHGFKSTEIQKKKDGSWLISNYGQLRSIRFDNSLEVPDLNRCTNVLGFKREKNSLYVHLQEGRSANIYLTKQPQTQPYIHDSNVEIKAISYNNSRIDITYQELFPGNIHLKGLTPFHKYVINANSHQVSKRASLSGSIELRVGESL